MQKTDQAYRIIAVVITVFGLGFISAGLFAAFYHRTLMIIENPEVSVALYPYALYAVPLTVLGLLILMVGIVLFVWAWGRRP